MLLNSWSCSISMAGVNRLHKRLMLLAFIVCGALLGPWMRPSHGAQVSGPVVILLSGQEEVYRRQAESFAEEIGLPTKTILLQGDQAQPPGVKDEVLGHRPALIYALGAKAAYAAKLWTKERQEIPVLFAMVLNWQRYQLLKDSTNIAGIAFEMSPGTQFVNMALFSPKVKRVGLVHGPSATSIVEQAKREAALLGLELVTESIERSQDFAHAFKKIEERIDAFCRDGDEESAGACRPFKKIEERIDAFWVMNDPVLYTMENLEWIDQRCLVRKLFCVGQSPNLAKMGFTLSVNPDLEQIGVQAAAMAKNILQRGQKPADLQVMEPLGTQILLNIDTARRIGLDLPDSSINMATSVVGRRDVIPSPQ